MDIDQQDSSSDDIPYLPPEEYKSYENQQRLEAQNPRNRHGRSHFTEDELRDLDASIDENPNAAPETIDSTMAIPNSPGSETIPSHNQYDDDETSYHAPPPIPQRQIEHHPSGSLDLPPNEMEYQSTSKISCGRRLIGLLLITIPAVLFGVAVHFVDSTMSDFQLFSSSFFIFQGIFWPYFGILLMDQFCTPRKHVSKNPDSIRKPNHNHNEKQVVQTKNEKWMNLLWIFLHSNLSAAVLILQILSIQRLNISVSLALSFGFDVIVALIRYILETGRCSWELLILSLISYLGFGVAVIPALVSVPHTSKHDTAIGVGASIGVMLLSIPSSFLLSHLRRNKVRESVLGTSFAFFGCIQALITKEITGKTFNLELDANSAGWIIGIISVVFLGTLFLHLETRLSGLIWERDDDEKPTNFSSITRTRIAVFILSCMWELARQGFRKAPVIYDVIGGTLVMISFLLAGGYQAWHRSNQLVPDTSTNASHTENNHKLCAFLPWLFSQRQWRTSSRR